ncbi:MAG: serine hydrolase [Gammaproteobacteria bacterium]|nr:serine hydrolase [Gammaproteobacteria bacterium]
MESLITHSSGLPRESDFPYWSAPDFPFPNRAEMIARLEKQETLYPASTYFQYSNLALTLAGEIVAARSGQSYAEYVRQYILEPLSLDDTQPHFRDEEYGKAMAVGYSARHRSGERSVVPKFDTRAIAPAAGFTSNVTDLAAFASWQFRLLKNGGSEVLKASTLREMHRVHWTDPDWKTTWGLGFVVAKAGEDTLVGHGGGCPGYRTAFTMLPKHQLAVIVMMNATGVNPQKVSQGIFKTIGPALAAAKKPPSETLEDLSLYEGVYDAQPWSGESAIVQWGNKLVVSGFPSDDPMASSIKLKRSKGHEFRRIRDDGDTPGEVWVFDVNDAGDVVAVSHHSNTDKKLR